MISCGRKKVKKLLKYGEFFGKMKFWSFFQVRFEQILVILHFEKKHKSIDNEVLGYYRYACCCCELWY